MLALKRLILIKAMSKNNCNPSRLPSLESKQLLRALRGALFREAPSNKLASGMAVLTTLELEYIVRGYHEYKRVWTPVLDDCSPQRLKVKIPTTNTPLF